MAKSKSKKPVKPRQSSRRAGSTVLDAQPDRVLEARFVAPAQLFLRFADGFEGTWKFSKLRLNMSGMKLTTIKASASGAVAVQSRWGDKVLLDAPSLRALVDPQYAVDIEISLNTLAGKIGL